MVSERLEVGHSVRRDLEQVARPPMTVELETLQLHRRAKLHAAIPCPLRALERLANQGFGLGGVADEPASDSEFDEQLPRSVVVGVKSDRALEQRAGRGEVCAREGTHARAPEEFARFACELASATTDGSKLFERPVRLLEMKAHDLVGRVSLLGQPVSELLVQPRAPRLRDSGVRGIADQHVLEREGVVGRRNSPSSNEPVAHQARKRLGHDGRLFGG